MNLLSFSSTHIIPSPLYLDTKNEWKKNWLCVFILLDSFSIQCSCCIPTTKMEFCWQKEISKWFGRNPHKSRILWRQEAHKKSINKNTNNTLTPAQQTNKREKEKKNTSNQILRSNVLAFNSISNLARKRRFNTVHSMLWQCLFDYHYAYTLLWYRCKMIETPRFVCFAIFRSFCNAKWKCVFVFRKQIV